jgi:hypothetical protein
VTQQAEEVEMRIKSTDTLVTTAVAKRRRSLPAEGTLPWGTPLRGLTVAEFAMSFRKHLPLVRANLVAAPSDRVLNGICHGLSNASLHSAALLLLIQEAQQERKTRKRRLKMRSSCKRQQKQQQEEDLTSSTEEERSQAEEQSDPVSAAVDFLLGLVGM